MIDTCLQFKQRLQLDHVMLTNQNSMPSRAAATSSNLRFRATDRLPAAGCVQSMGSRQRVVNRVAWRSEPVPRRWPSLVHPAGQTSSPLALDRLAACRQATRPRAATKRIQYVEQEKTERTEGHFLCCLCFLLFKMRPRKQEIGNRNTRKSFRERCYTDGIPNFLVLLTAQRFCC